MVHIPQTHWPKKSRFRIGRRPLMRNDKTMITISILCILVWVRKSMINISKLAYANNYIKGI